MPFSVDLARSFMTTRARVLDRRRFDALFDESRATRSSIVEALDSYRNSDGGYGWGLEPDLRAHESQPAGALHAFEALASAGEPAADLVDDRAASLLDWLSENSLTDGGLPFAFPISDPAGCAPFWVRADHLASSLQITAAIAAQAHRVARFSSVTKTHPWLARATAYCFGEIGRMTEPPSEPPRAYVLQFSLQLLDAISETHDDASDLLAKLFEFVPADGLIPVAGGADGESLRPLNFAATPGRPIRDRIDAAVIETDLKRLANAQQEDGGWAVDFDSYSPAAALEWRGHATVQAIETLHLNERL